MEALQLLKERKPHHPVVIFTDSKSTCLNLASFHCSNPKNYILNNIAHLIDESSQPVTIQWIPSHSGISGNESADVTAKRFASLDHTSPFSPPLPDVLHHIKTTTLQRWQQHYDEVSKVKGRFHYSIQPSVSLTPWFTEFCDTLTRHDIAVLTRLRTGHSKTKARLYSMKLADSPLCSTCNVPEDEVHIFQDCMRYSTSRLEEDYRTLLARHKPDDVKKLLKFIKDINYDF